jgi:hypothetical protein
MLYEAIQSFPVQLSVSAVLNLKVRGGKKVLVFYTNFIFHHHLNN